MNRKNISKKSVFITVTFLTIVTVVAVFALISSKLELDNMFGLGTPKVRFVETFDAPNEDELIFGNSYHKSGKVINDSNKAVKARVKITAEWSNGVSNDLGNGLYAAKLHFNGTVSSLDGFPFNSDGADKNGKWVYENGYFYYGGKNGVIDANSQSEPLLDSVSFSKELNEQKRNKNYYISSEYKADPSKAIVFKTQEEASEAAAKKEPSETAISYREEVVYKFSEFTSQTLTVTFINEIQNLDENWD